MCFNKISRENTESKRKDPEAIFLRNEVFSSLNQNSSSSPSSSLQSPLNNLRSSVTRVVNAIFWRKEVTRQRIDVLDIHPKC